MYIQIGMVSLVDVEFVLSISKLSMCVLNHNTAFLPGVYMLYICCIYVVYMLYICCIYVVYMLYICCIYVVYMLYICWIRHIIFQTKSCI